jgi:hypothetical protein
MLTPCVDGLAGAVVVKRYESRDDKGLSDGGAD